MPYEPLPSLVPDDVPRIGVRSWVPLLLAALLLGWQSLHTGIREVEQLGRRGFGARGLALRATEEERFAAAGAAGETAALVRAHVPRRGEVLVVAPAFDARFVAELALLSHPRRVRAGDAAAIAAELPDGGWVLAREDAELELSPARDEASAAGWRLVRIGSGGLR